MNKKHKPKLRKIDQNKLSKSGEFKNLKKEENVNVINKNNQKLKPINRIKIFAKNKDAAKDNKICLFDDNGQLNQLQKLREQRKEFIKMKIGNNGSKMKDLFTFNVNQ